MKKNKTNPELTNLHEIFQKWKISQPVIAGKIGMPLGTFKTKLNSKQAAYNFTPEERAATIKALFLMAHEITHIYKQGCILKVKAVKQNSKHKKLI